jgi:phosphoglycolate phosphatase
LIRVKNVLLDLDGTVTDPFEGIAGCIQYAMISLDLTPPVEEDLRRAVGPPLRQSFSRFLGTHDVGRINEAMRLYRERFATSGLFENRVYAGVPEMLAKLDAAGCSLFIATSKPRIFAQRIMDHFELAKYFAGIYGSELNGGYENKSDLLRFLLENERLDARVTAMVGDRSHDMIPAKEHDLFAVGVAWGYGSIQELNEAGADLICNHPCDVVSFVAKSVSEWGPCVERAWPTFDRPKMNGCPRYRF